MGTTTKRIRYIPLVDPYLTFCCYTSIDKGWYIIRIQRAEGSSFNQYVIGIGTFKAVGFSKCPAHKAEALY